MGKFREYLNSLNKDIIGKPMKLMESPVKISGDAPFETLNGRSKSISYLTDDSHIIGKIGKYEVYKHNKLDYIIVGDYYIDDVINEKRFGIIAELSFTSDKLRSSNKITNKEYIKIQTIQVKEANRKEKIASRLYLLMLESYIIISDGVQYAGAVALWKSFIKIPNIKVYVYDIVKDKVIVKMTSKTHDNTIWSNGDLGDYSKNSTLLVLSL